MTGSVAKKLLFPAALLVAMASACQTTTPEEGLTTAVNLCRAAWDGENGPMIEDACTEVIEKTQYDRTRANALNYRVSSTHGPAGWRRLWSTSTKPFA
jgi:hypothetical protein